ncbi:hypothetical protein DFH29DRAFT_883977 [Suillus ampliporus]|nr:hypothetical protein DFH29DRAFT_883977 [Suillus ampliporus]
MFGSTSKRITKLTDKAKAALEGSSKKQKNDASSMTSTSEPKKAKPNRISGSSKDRDTELLSPSPPAEDVPTKPTQSCKSVIRMEEEEAAMYEDAIEISDTNQSSNDGVDNADNDNKDELSDTDKEESPEDELKRLMKDWISPVYTFFNPKPRIVIIKGQCAHEFKCFGKSCKATVH